jgi:hypothetical protein
MREVAGEELSFCILLYRIEAFSRRPDPQYRGSVVRFIV